MTFDFRWRSFGTVLDQDSLIAYSKRCQAFVGTLGGAGPVLHLCLWRLGLGWWPSSDSVWWKGDLADLGRQWGPIRWWAVDFYQLSIGEHVWLQWGLNR